MIDGYYYPTQPGDVDDLRTWCTVVGLEPSLYRCKGEGEDEFGLVKSVVKGATWKTIQNAVKNETVRMAFREAVEVLLRDDTVHAIIGQAGFFAFFQSFVEDIITELVAETHNTSAPLRRKPMLLGTPLLAQAFTPETPDGRHSGWGLAGPKQRALTVTSHFDPLKNNVVDILEGCYGNTTSVREWIHANVDRFTALGWNQMPGYGIPVVYGALFHNVFVTVNSYERSMQQTLDNAAAQGEEIVAIILESTEMPAHSNNIRNFTGLPVWDISTLGKCLMGAAPIFDRENPHIADAVFSNEAFRRCMMAWYDEPLNVEPRFGLQKDGKIKYYEDQGLTREELATLTCVGGRPEGGLPIGRKMEHFVTGIGGPSPFPSACTLTHAYCVCDGCDGTCAGSGSCGEPSSACGVRGEYADSADCKGALTDVAAVCPVVSSDIFNGGNI